MYWPDFKSHTSCWNLIFLTASKAQRSLKKLCCSCCGGNMSKNGTKNVRERLSCLKGQNLCIMFFLSHFIVMCGLSRLSVVLYGLLWAFFWSFIVKYRFDWICIVFSRGHRSKFIWFCSRKPFQKPFFSWLHASFDTLWVQIFRQRYDH